MSSWTAREARNNNNVSFNGDYAVTKIFYGSPRDECGENLILFRANK